MTNAFVTGATGFIGGRLACELAARDTFDCLHCLVRNPASSHLLESDRIRVFEGDHARQVSKQRALVKALLTRALKGDVRAANLLLSMMMRLLDTGEGAPEAVEDLHPDELEVLEAYKERLTRSNAKEPPAEAAESREESS